MPKEKRTAASAPVTERSLMAGIDGKKSNA